MKALLSLVLLLALITCASAESIKVGNYTVSFEMKQTHMVEVTNVTDNLLDKMLIVKTFNGSVGIIPGWHVKSWNDAYNLDQITIGGLQGKIGTFKEEYDAFYPDGLIISKLHMDETVDFLRSLHIKKN
jgi:hypothetical protein